DAEAGIDDRADRTGRGWVVDRHRLILDVLPQLLVAGARLGGDELAGYDRLECRLLGDLEGDSHARQDRLAVLVGRQVVVEDARLRVRARRAQRDRAAACGLYNARAEGDSMLERRAQAFLVEQHRCAVELAVRRLKAGTRPHETAGLGDVRGQRATSLGPPPFEAL